jgi:hypothetical protein
MSGILGQVGDVIRGADPINPGQEFDYENKHEDTIDGHHGTWQKKMTHPDLLHAKRWWRFIAEDGIVGEGSAKDDDAAMVAARADFHKNLNAPKQQ